MPNTTVLVASLLAITFANAPVPHVTPAMSAVAFSTSEQELSEDDALDRFEIDEWFLPRLNVELPGLFDWSEADSAYYAHAGHGSHVATAPLIGLC